LHHILTLAGGLAGITALTVLAAGPGIAATPAHGSAQVINANASVLGALRLDLTSTRVTYPSGGTRALVHLGLLGQDPGLAQLTLVDVHSGIEHGALNSRASVADLNLLGLIHADVLTASCTATAHGVTGSSDIVGVSIAGTPVNPHALGEKITANNPVPLNDLLSGLLTPLVGKAITITFDEHVLTGDTLTVNALHVHINTALLGLPALAQSDIIVSQAVCTKGDLPSSTGPTGATTPSAPSNSPSTSPHPTQSPAGGMAATTPGGTPATTAPTVATASDQHALAYTGVSGIVPMITAAVLLVAAGTGLFFFSRHRAASRRP
jgi:hypothetical protein